MLPGCVGAEIDAWKVTDIDATEAWNTRIPSRNDVIDDVLEKLRVDYVNKLIKGVRKQNTIAAEKLGLAEDYPELVCGIHADAIFLSDVIEDFIEALESMKEKTNNYETNPNLGAGTKGNPYD